MTSDEWLKCTDPIPWEDFNSRLKGQNVMMPSTKGFEANRQAFEQQWERAKERDPERPRLSLLESYNEADVKPFVEATEILIRAYWENDRIVMLKDGLGAPGLAERILCQSQIDQALVAHVDSYRRCVESYSPVKLPREILEKKQEAYFKQDYRFKPHNVRLSHIDMQSIYDEHGGCCLYCHKKLDPTKAAAESKKTTEENVSKTRDDKCAWTLDRVCNQLPHRKGNLVLACATCNKARSNQNAYLFWRQRALERQKNTLINVLGHDGHANDEDRPREDFIIDIRKHGITGGFSGTMHRHLKVGDPQPPAVKWDQEGQQWYQEEFYGSNQIQTIIGFDFCNLYPSIYLMRLACGPGVITRVKPEKSDQMLQKILDDRDHVYLVRCDGAVPEADFDRWAMWPPFHVNGKITWDMLSETQRDYELDQAKRRGVPLNTASWCDYKLCPVMRFKQGWLCDEAIRWYVEHGLEITNLTLVAKFDAGRPLAPFIEKFAQRRLEGKLAGNSVIEMLNKLIPNSSWGKLAQNPALYTKSRALGLDYDQVYSKVQKPDFQRLSTFPAGGKTVFVSEHVEKDIMEAQPVHAGFMILQLSKLRMLRWIYDFLFKYVPRDRLQISFSDTDSIYLALSHSEEITDDKARTDLATYVRPELLPEYLGELYALMPGHADLGSTITTEVYSLDKHCWETYQVVRRECYEETKRSLPMDYVNRRGFEAKDLKDAKCSQDYTKAWIERTVLPYLDPKHSYTFIQPPGGGTWLCFDDYPSEKIIDYIHPELREQFENDTTAAKMVFKCQSEWEPLDMAQRYTPGMMVPEWWGDEVISLNSKTYCKFGDDNKPTMKSKGVKVVDPQAYRNTIATGQTYQVDSGQIIADPVDRRMRTRVNKKDALTARYTKGYLFPNSLQVAPHIELA